MKFSNLIKFDQMWCGRHQVPASLLLQLSGEEKSPTKLAAFRFFLSVFLLGELVGYFMITLGLYSSRPVWVFICGVVLKVGGELLSAFFQNRSGTFLSLELQRYLERLHTHALEIRSFLADKGCTETEINSLSSLPRDVYQSELNSYQRTRILNIGAPLFCGLATFLNGDIYISIIIILLGLLSFPISEKFFRENTFRSESELRLGLATQLIPYLEKVYKEHVWLTTKVNFLSQLPLLLFMLRFIWNGTGQLLASFFGLSQGLMGLTGSLAFQKARAASIRTSEMTTHLIHVLSSPYLIVTPQRWKEHCAQGGTQIPIKHGERNGVALENFSPNIPFEEKGIFAISTFISSGSICLLRAPSGKGKTTFLSALTHIIEHRGDLLFIAHGKVINAHRLTREELDRKIFYFREENIEKSARLVDLFKATNFVDHAPFLEKAKKQFEPTLVDLAWKASDNLIDQEVKNIETHQHSAFPESMLDFLRELQKRQSDQIQRLLKQTGGNLESDRIYPKRNFSTLSSGEKKRLTAFLALEACRTIQDLSLVVLDEPLTHLDQFNIDYQLQAIAQMQKHFAPSILIISHQGIDEMKKQLGQIEEIEL